MTTKCKNCGHNADMHSDGEHTHIGECCIELKDGNFCDCKDFVKEVADVQ